MVLVLLFPGCGNPSTQVMDMAVEDTAPLDTFDTDTGDMDTPEDDPVEECISTGAEVCDGMDNDCDGSVDEDFALATDPSNCGACGYACVTPNGTPGCTSGECTVITCNDGYYNVNNAAFDGCEYSCTAGGTIESLCLDGFDDDCDGRTDGDDPDCSACVPEFCDMADNDCDSLIDEDFDLRTDPLNCGTCGHACSSRPHAAPACVMGECAITCEAGWANLDLVDANGCEGACIPATSPDEFACDGVDDDCDGTVDEDYIPYSCGVGRCVTNSVCWEGAEECEPLTPIATSDAVCDNVDEDCDGATDEEFAPSTLCVGLCRTTATCVDGTEFCGTPAGFDSSCDNVDDDCDTVPDEDYIPYTCGSGGCTRQSTCYGGYENCVEGGPAPEICNGSDDDCDDVIDNGDPAAMCTPVPPNGTGLCSGGVCTIGACTSGFFDVDTVYGNGCECQQEATESSSLACGTAYDLGSFADTGTTTTVSGNIVPSGEEDWYRFTAVDNADSSCDSFNVSVAFTLNPGSVFRMDIYRGSCSDGSPCLNVNDQMQWYTNMSTGSMTSKVGECQCRTSNVYDYNFCTDNSATFYVKVYRAASAPVTCDNYTIRISNGV